MREQRRKKKGGSELRKIGEGNHIKSCEEESPPT